MTVRRVGAWNHPWRRTLVGELGPLLLVVLLAVPVALPLCQGKQLSGQDAYVYPPSVVEFALGVREGQFLPRWAPDVGEDTDCPYSTSAPLVLWARLSVPPSRRGGRHRREPGESRPPRGGRPRYVRLGAGLLWGSGRGRCGGGLYVCPVCAL